MYGAQISATDQLRPLGMDNSLCSTMGDEWCACAHVYDRVVKPILCFLVMDVWTLALSSEAGKTVL